METKHTPGLTLKPWQLEEDRSIQIPFEGEYVQVACLALTRWTEPNQDKNERLRQLTKNVGREIVEAVNSHAALTVALDQAVEALEAQAKIKHGGQYCFCNRMPVCNDWHMSCCKAANAALDAAKKARG